MADMTIRPAEEKDRAAVEEIARDALSALRGSPSVSRWGSAMRRDFVEHWFPPLGSTLPATTMLVVEHEERVIAAGSTRPGKRHPHAFMRLGVSVHARRRGAGTVLYNALVAATPGPIVVREMLADPATIDFFKARGFVTGERTLEGTIDPRYDETVYWIEAALATKSSRFSIGHAEGTAADLAAARAIDSLYGWIHPWSRPQPVPDEALVETYLRTVQPEGLLTASLDGTQVGVAIVTDSPFGAGSDVAHLSFCGVVDPTVPHAASITTALTAEILSAVQRRRRKIEIEVNHHNTFLWDTVMAIPGARLFSDMTLLVDRYGA